MEELRYVIGWSYPIDNICIVKDCGKRRYDIYAHCKYHRGLLNINPKLKFEKRNVTMITMQRRFHI